MSYTTRTLSDVTPFDSALLLQGISRRVILGAVVVGFGTVAAAWVITASPTTNPNINENAPVALKIVVSANPYGALAGAAYSFATAPVLIDPGFAPYFTLDAAPSPPSAAAPEPASVPQPPPKLAVPALTKSVPLRPSNSISRSQAKHGTVRSLARQAGSQVIAANPASAASDNRNFFEKLFNTPQQASGPILAYARPEDSGISAVQAYNKSIALPPSESPTAVYDIEAHTVYMPNGDKLEAHSGLGNRLDDPRHVNEKDRGATPPHAYDLVLRKQPFHGVPALRLNPVGGGSMFGRTGILAHTYMLGPNGDSNGCVSFKDYSKFLQAFARGEVRRLVVVTHLG